MSVAYKSKEISLGEQRNEKLLSEALMFSKTPPFNEAAILKEPEADCAPEDTGSAVVAGS